MPTPSIRLHPSEPAHGMRGGELEGWGGRYSSKNTLNPALIVQALLLPRLALPPHPLHTHHCHHAHCWSSIFWSIMWEPIISVKQELTDIDLLLWFQQPSMKWTIPTSASCTNNMVLHPIGSVVIFEEIFLKYLK